jgi:desulfoferrodoxin (superoxide reductase-like protein)
MKYYSIILMSIITLLSINIATAHPPSEIELEFDLTEHILKVQVHHGVKKIAHHYIEKIVVELNDMEVITQRFTVQGSEETQDAVYMIADAKEGDTLTVTAYCNISGKKKAALEVAAEPAEGKGE